MRKMYETEWFGIKFSELPDNDLRQLADESFYSNFYAALFRKFKCYDELTPSYRQQKSETAEFIATQCQRSCKVLSVGCGLGYIENILIRDYSENFDLYVSDFSSVSMRWLRQVISKDRINNQSKGLRFETIYMVALDYAIDEKGMIDFLMDLKASLLPEGKIIIVSATTYKRRVLESIRHMFKRIVKGIFELLKFRDRGKFWGWERHLEDYELVAKKSGFSISSVDSVGGCISYTLQQRI